MRFIWNFLSENKHFYLLLLLLPLLVWFNYLELTIVPEYYIYSHLDDRIPFVKEFVVPYIIWFVYIAYAIIYTGLNCRREYCKLLIFLGAGMAIAYTICTIFPNGQNLRPVITQDDPFSMIVKYIYATDTSTNVWPSVHVINSIAANTALQHTEKFSRGKIRRYVSHILTILICASTVLIKQHSILDVAGGIMVATLVYIPLYPYDKGIFENAREFEGLKDISELN